MENTKLCFCGKPLHYTNSMTRAMVEALIKENGEYINVVSLFTNKTYRASRHYIALHGLKGDELDKKGSEEIKK